MSAAQRKQVVPVIREVDAWQHVDDMPSHEGDFVPELHRARSAGTASNVFGETMSKKTASTADARQKRG